MLSFVIQRGIVAGVVAGAEELHLKFRWVFAANITTLAVMIAALSSTNLLVVAICGAFGCFLIRQVGDLPKAELEAAKKPKEQQPTT